MTSTINISLDRFIGMHRHTGDQAFKRAIIPYFLIPHCVDCIQKSVSPMAGVMATGQSV